MDEVIDLVSSDSEADCVIQQEDVSTLISEIPDIRSLFLQFNAMFFENKLDAVEVSWSSRMTLCAGICKYEGRGGLCAIRLSEPLLKFRPRSDLVNTLLHEMIHAFLFVTQKKRDRSAHGPSFIKLMNEINARAETCITVYHTFNDEVDLYRVHWWQCDGSCRNSPPYFGIVKRASNRKPSPRDFWWAEHQRNCGGTFVKIKEPESKGKKRKQPEKKSGSKQNPTENSSSSSLKKYFSKS
jgi:predicted SprT family Zn-dependent metalloprotease